MSSSRDYDTRRHEERDYSSRPYRRSHRNRSRSRSPEARDNDADNKRQLESERMKRMARLRAENEAEESRMVALEKAEGKEEDSNALNPTETFVPVNEEELKGLDEEEQMKRLLGFTGGFGSTKGQKVEDNHSSAARGAATKNKARKYRQYMNRKNGFNRPLDKID